MSRRFLSRNMTFAFGAVQASGAKYMSADSTVSFFAETLDCGLLTPDNNTLMKFSDPLPPSIANGIHFNLYNNLWDTNYPLWYDQDDMFRFILHL